MSGAQSAGDASPSAATEDEAPADLQEERRRPGRQPQPSICQVTGCHSNLRLARSYYQRYRICEAHMKAQSLELDGAVVRFCQQCGRFQDLALFSEGQRSCRERLTKHAARRRHMHAVANLRAAKRARGEASDLSDREIPSFDSSDEYLVRARRQDAPHSDAYGAAALLAGLARAGSGGGAYGGGGAAAHWAQQQQQQQQAQQDVYYGAVAPHGGAAAAPAAAGPLLDVAGSLAALLSAFAAPAHRAPAPAPAAPAHVPSAFAALAGGSDAALQMLRLLVAGHAAPAAPAPPPPPPLPPPAGDVMAALQSLLAAAAAQAPVAPAPAPYVPPPPPPRPMQAVSAPIDGSAQADVLKALLAAMRPSPAAAPAPQAPPQQPEPAAAPAPAEQLAAVPSP